MVTPVLNGQWQVVAGGAYSLVFSQAANEAWPTLSGGSVLNLYDDGSGLVIAAAAFGVAGPPQTVTVALSSALTKTWIVENQISWSLRLNVGGQQQILQSGVGLTSITTPF